MQSNMQSGEANTGELPHGSAVRLAEPLARDYLRATRNLHKDGTTRANGATHDRLSDTTVRVFPSSSTACLNSSSVIVTVSEMPLPLAVSSCG